MTGFSVEGSTEMLKPGTTVALTAPGTRVQMGTLTLQASGAYIFVPEPGYLGPAPAIHVYSISSDGQTCISALTIDVVTRECWAGLGCMRGAIWPKPAADTSPPLPPPLLPALPRV